MDVAAQLPQGTLATPCPPPGGGAKLGLTQHGLGDQAPQDTKPHLCRAKHTVQAVGRSLVPVCNSAGQVPACSARPSPSRSSNSRARRRRDEWDANPKRDGECAGPDSAVMAGLPTRPGKARRCQVWSFIQTGLFGSCFLPWQTMYPSKGVIVSLQLKGAQLKAPGF